MLAKGTHGAGRHLGKLACWNPFLGLDVLSSPGPPLQLWYLGGLSLGLHLGMA